MNKSKLLIYDLWFVINNFDLLMGNDKLQISYEYSNFSDKRLAIISKTVRINYEPYI